MTTTQMVAVLDTEIQRLQQVRELLAGAAPPLEKTAPKARRETDKAGGADHGTKRTRVLSPEARERIAAAQRARWAAHSAAKTTGGAGKPGKGGKRAGGRGAGTENTDDAGVPA